MPQIKKSGNPKSSINYKHPLTRLLQLLDATIQEAHIIKFRNKTVSTFIRLQISIQQYHPK